MRKRLCLLALLFVGVMPLVRGASDVYAQNGPASCSVIAQNQFVRDALFEYYYWNHELPPVSPVFFPSPEAYLEAVRYRPLDLTYSYIANRAEQESFFSESQFIGLGISTQFNGTEMRVSQVFPDSPASESGLVRGQRILRINGRTIADLNESGLLGTAFGANQEGVSVSLVWQTAAGERSATLVKRAVTIPTVSALRLYDVDGKKVGYLNFRNFVQPSFAALDAAFAQLHDAGANELVLDLRYNGGGLVAVAQHLASLIGGARTVDQLFAEFFHNDRHDDLNRTLRFESKPNALGLSRLVVIATRASASASELVINSLRPFIPVVIVGDTTYGKPVGQYSFPFCDKVLNPVSFILRNARGEADFFSGFPADCPAPDDLDHQFGEATEGSLAEAFVYLRTGACTPPPATAEGRARTAAARARARAILPTDGWQQLLGAH
jgi:carboxyl-terminal processing protease